MKAIVTVETKKSYYEMDYIKVEKFVFMAETENEDEILSKIYNDRYLNNYRHNLKIEFIKGNAKTED